jgi:hypothetical protein
MISLQLYLNAHGLETHALNGSMLRQFHREQIFWNFDFQNFNSTAERSDEAMLLVFLTKTKIRHF